jgi:hypothetical protein
VTDRGGEHRPVSSRTGGRPYLRQRPHRARSRPSRTAATIRGKAYVSDLREEFAFASDVTERTLAAFDERGIETPKIPAGAFGRGVEGGPEGGTEGQGQEA